MDLLGIGTNQLRKIPTDDRFRIRMDELAKSVAADRAAGFLPAIVVGNAGTVNTGAIDPLDAHRRLLRARVPVVPRRRGLRRARRDRPGIEAAVLRDGARGLDRHRPAQVDVRALRGGGHARPRARAPGRDVPEVPRVPRRRPGEPGPGPAWFAERGVELSRGFKALKVWMGLKTHGRKAYAAQIQQRRARWRTSWPPRWTAGPTSSGWPSRSSRSRTSATGRRAATSRTPSSTAINRTIINRLVGDGAFFLAPTMSARAGPRSASRS